MIRQGLDLGQFSRVRITRHAREAIAARGMTGEDLARVLDRGRIRPGHTGRHIIQAGQDSVIVAGQGDTLIICTAIRNGIPGARKGR